MDPYAQTKAAYEKGYIELEADWVSMGPRMRHIQLAFELSQSKRPQVLELGCGPGRDAAVMVPLAKKYVGIDYSPGLIDIARTKVPLGVFVVGDMVGTPYPPNSDVIIAFASVLHLTSQQLKQVLAKAHASLRPGGVFYISTKAGTGTISKESRYGVRTYYFYDASRIHQLAGPGFTLVHERVEHIRDQDWTEMALKRL